MSKCEECGFKVFEEKGYLVCSSCGLVQQRILEGSDKGIETTLKKHKRIPKGEKRTIGITKVDTQATEFMKEVFALLEIPEKIQKQTRSCYYRCARNEKIIDHVLLTAVCLINNSGESTLTNNDEIEAYHLFGRILLEEDIEILLEYVHKKDVLSKGKEEEEYIFEELLELQEEDSDLYDIAERKLKEYEKPESVFLRNLIPRIANLCGKIQRGIRGVNRIKAMIAENMF